MSRLASELRQLGEGRRSFADGEFLFREGNPGAEMFVIQRGAVRVSKRVGGQDLLLSVLNRGDFLGEMSLLERLPRDADARAVGATVVLVIGQGGLLLRIRRDPTFALELLNRLSHRVRQLNARLVELKGGAGPEAAQLPAQ